MTIAAFNPQPGFINDGTNYISKGNWYTGDRVRFKEGYPQKIGGWEQQQFPFAGICRNLKCWKGLPPSSQAYTGIGTSSNYYVTVGGPLQDITPYAAGPTSLGGSGTGMSAVGGGSTLVELAFTAWDGFQNGDLITVTGAVGPVGDYTTSQLNGTFPGYVSGASTYIDLGIPSVTVSNGGGSVVMLSWVLPPGKIDSTTGNGWGWANWSSGPWGGINNVPTISNDIRLWSSDNFGQDLVINPRGYGISYWAAGSLDRAVNISTLFGSSDPPVAANYILVSPSDRRIFAFGVNVIGSLDIDPLFIRWSDAESASNWTPDITNSAGSLRLSYGSQIYGAAIARGEILVWTESSLHALQFVGGDLVYGVQLVSPNTDLISPNGMVTVGDFAMWMGRDNFFMYDGTTRALPCSVRQEVFGNININQSFKVLAASNRLHREIWFFYPSADSLENNKYVIFNYESNSWYFGNMDRTAWFDSGIQLYPIGASPDGHLYYQEFGTDDGSTSPASPLGSFIESGPIEIDNEQQGLGDGDRFTFMRKIIPDVTFDGSTSASPSVQYTVAGRNYPGGTIYNPDQNPVTRSSTTPVERFTNKIDTRIRGRSFTINVSEDGLGINWRLGVQRFDTQPDGRR